MQRWLVHRWLGPDEGTLASYQATFENAHGQRVLHHLLDTVYCSIYEGTDPIELAMHNGRRSVVHDILKNLDTIDQLQKLNVVTTEDRDVRLV